MVLVAPPAVVVSGAGSARAGSFVDLRALSLVAGDAGLVGFGLVLFSIGVAGIGGAVRRGVSRPPSPSLRDDPAKALPRSAGLIRLGRSPSEGFGAVMRSSRLVRRPVRLTGCGRSVLRRWLGSPRRARRRLRRVVRRVYPGCAAVR